ncbi:unnamed protein product [Linum trigynum]|uniref:Uncharacterized protein n=1 Tax=Linum trigynum TaxID=586398 RepID=A0AAV2FX64_9ROSI
MATRGDSYPLARTASERGLLASNLTAETRRRTRRHESPFKVLGLVLAKNDDQWGPRQPQLARPPILIGAQKKKEEVFFIHS